MTIIRQRLHLDAGKTDYFFGPIHNREVANRLLVGQGFEEKNGGFSSPGAGATYTIEEVESVLELQVAIHRSRRDPHAPKKGGGYAGLPLGRPRR